MDGLQNWTLLVCFNIKLDDVIVKEPKSASVSDLGMCCLAAEIVPANISGDYIWNEVDVTVYYVT